MQQRAHDDLDARLASGVSALGLPDDASCRARCLAFVELLKTWNRAYNLTATDDGGEIVTRHVLDSLSVAPHLCGRRIIDVGTGAGFPGIPLAIWHPECEFHLLDSNGKKMRFLFQAKQALKLDNVWLHEKRIENLRDATGFDCILSRAVASLAEMVRLGAHLLAADGCFLLMKGQLGDDELNAVAEPYNVVSCQPLSVPGIVTPRQLVKIMRRSVPVP